MKKRTAAALLAAVAAALAYRPSRETIGDVFITVGGHLAYGPPPPRTPVDEARGRRRIMDAVREYEHGNARNGRYDSPV